ncbi:MAG: hypothetical protein KJ749_07925 [Planctomycetes bacterium]|nr:hypothetical protein [Planctomycetota bacterium]
MSQIDFANSTDLSSARLLGLCRKVAADWSVGRIKLQVRFSRGADFSGTCFYADRRILVNLGRHLRYPYKMGTLLARAKSYGRSWSKPVYSLEMQDGYEVALFVFLHELYHLLIRKARRNTRQKESMCDRFAARYLVDHFAVLVRDEAGGLVARSEWDFQDVEGFVAAARRRRPPRAARAARKPVPIDQPGEQMLLFPL